MQSIEKSFPEFRGKVTPNLLSEWRVAKSQIESHPASMEMPALTDGKGHGAYRTKLIAMPEADLREEIVEKAVARLKEPSDRKTVQKYADILWAIGKPDAIVAVVGEAVRERKGQSLIVLSVLSSQLAKIADDETNTKLAKTARDLSGILSELPSTFGAITNIVTTKLASVVITSAKAVGYTVAFVVGIPLLGIYGLLPTSILARINRFFIGKKDPSTEHDALWDLQKPSIGVEAVSGLGLGFYALGTLIYQAVTGTPLSGWLGMAGIVSGGLIIDSVARLLYQGEIGSIPLELTYTLLYRLPAHIIKFSRRKVHDALDSIHKKQIDLIGSTATNALEAHNEPSAFPASSSSEDQK
ncbi:MAG: hypothetical protein ABIJ10_07575 [Candidatus Micrarchaeota archaeon]